MATKATEHIIYWAKDFMGISDPLPFEESRMASYIVSMLPVDDVVTLPDITDACLEISTTYQYVDKDKLADELGGRIYKSTLKARTKSSIFILGSLLLGWVLFRKR